MEQVKLAVIGAGPAGIATAVEAKEANIGPVMVLEKKPISGRETGRSGSSKSQGRAYR